MSVGNCHEQTSPLPALKSLSYIISGNLTSLTRILNIDQKMRVKISGDVRSKRCMVVRYYFYYLVHRDEWSFISICTTGESSRRTARQYTSYCERLFTSLDTWTFGSGL